MGRKKVVNENVIEILTNESILAVAVLIVPIIKVTPRRQLVQVYLDFVQVHMEVSTESWVLTNSESWA